jgi:hypothetical protein
MTLNSFSNTRYFINDQIIIGLYGVSLLQFYTIYLPVNLSD